MVTPDERMDDLIARWATVFDEHLSQKEARQVATKLINFYRLICRTCPQLPHLTSEDFGGIVDFGDIEKSVPKPPVGFRR